MNAALLIALSFLTFRASPESDYFWADAMMGYSLKGYGLPDNVNAGGTLNYSRENHLVHVGVSDGRKLFSDDGDPYYEELYLSYGRHFVKKKKKTTISIGLGTFKDRVFVNCKSSNSFSDSDCGLNTVSKTVGIPVDFTQTYGKYAGFGVNVHANLNDINSYIAVRLSISFGVFN